MSHTVYMSHAAMIDSKIRCSLQKGSSLACEALSLYSKKCRKVHKRSSQINHSFIFSYCSQWIWSVSQKAWAQSRITSWLAHVTGHHENIHSHLWATEQRRPTQTWREHVKHHTDSHPSSGLNQGLWNCPS